MAELALRGLWLVPGLPLLGFLVLGLAGSRLPRRAVGVVACGSILLAFVVAAAAACATLSGPLDRGLQGGSVRVLEDGRGAELVLWRWMPGAPSGVLGPEAGALPVAAPRFDVAMGLLLDPLSAVLMLVVTGIGFLIHVYAAGYMWSDPGYARFFAYMNLFVAMMLVLVLGSSFPVTFLGWEGVGLCSYLLIGFHYREAEPPRAGMKAFVVNRVGDAGLLLGMLLLFAAFGTLSHSELAVRAAAAPGWAGSGLAALVAALLFLGAMGKSAQAPLHVWLPDAMAGPTPVSALIHAATMVTAGVFLVIRANVFFQAAPAVSLAVAVVGALTALMAASIALVQTDIKRVLAYSTVSQLGYMFLAVGSGAYAAGLFHLVTHAFFKALLFLGAGSVSHALDGELDLRRMGGLRRALPATHAVMLIATLAIAGVPPLAGFWSKDEILAGVVASSFGSGVGWGLWLAGLAGAVMTAFYMTRAYCLAFHGEPRYPAGAHPHESPPIMTVPLFVLAGLSVAGGLLGLPHWTGASNWIAGVLAPVVHSGALAGDGHVLGVGLELALVAAATAAAVLGLVAGWRWYHRASPAPARMAAAWPRLTGMLRARWAVDEVLNVMVVAPVVRLAAWSGSFDRRVVDFILEAHGHAAALAGEVLRGFSSGRVRTQALTVFAGAAALVAWFLWS